MTQAPGAALPRRLPIGHGSRGFGNTGFVLTDAGKAQLKSVVTDAAVAMLDA